MDRTNTNHAQFISIVKPTLGIGVVDVVVVVNITETLATLP
jgi:hypothetical protein